MRGASSEARRAAGEPLQSSHATGTRTGCSRASAAQRSTGRRERGVDAKADLVGLGNRDAGHGARVRRRARGASGSRPRRLGGGCHPGLAHHGDVGRDGLRPGADDRRHGADGDGRLGDGAGDGDAAGGRARSRPRRRGRGRSSRPSSDWRSPSCERRWRGSSSSSRRCGCSSRGPRRPRRARAAVARAWEAVARRRLAGRRQRPGRQWDRGQWRPERRGSPGGLRSR